MDKDDTAVARTWMVRVEPAGHEIEVRPSESLIEAAWRGNIYWPTVCGGRAECTACVMRILDGGEPAAPPDEREEQQLETVRQRTGSEDEIRLACCFHPRGRAVVEKKGVRKRLR